MKRRISKTKVSQRASVLVLTLIVVSLLTLGAMAFFQKMFLEARATQAHGRKLQARHFAESGLDYMRYLLTQPRATLMQSGGLYANPQMLKGVLVYDDPLAAYRGRFTLIAPDMTTDGFYQGIRYGGVENESSKLNLNTLALLDSASTALGGGGSGGTTGSTGTSATGAASAGSSTTGSTTGGSTTGGSSTSGSTAGGSSGSSTGGSVGHNLLMTLPGMTDAIADAILDWVDSDDTPRWLAPKQANTKRPDIPINRATARCSRSTSCCWFATSRPHCYTAPI